MPSNDRICWRRQHRCLLRGVHRPVPSTAILAVTRRAPARGRVSERTTHATYSSPSTVSTVPPGLVVLNTASSRPSGADASTPRPPAAHMSAAYAPTASSAPATSAGTAGCTSTGTRPFAACTARATRTASPTNPTVGSHATPAPFADTTIADDGRRGRLMVEVSTRPTPERLMLRAGAGCWCYSLLGGLSAS